MPAIAAQSRLTRPWQPSNLYGNLPGIARMYGQNAMLEEGGEDTDPLRRRLNELGSQAMAGPESTRGAELAARLGRGSTTGTLKSAVPTETMAALQSMQSGVAGMSSPYLNQLAEIGRIGTTATQIQQAKLAYQQRQAAAAPIGGGGGGLDLSKVPKGARQKILQYARGQLGVPYVWGGTSPGRGLDCSGLVQYAYGKAGIRLPRVSQQQMTRGVRVPISKLLPGDLIGWGHPATHIAIYAGNGRIIEAPRSGLRVREIPLSQKGGGAWGIHLRI